MRTSGLIALALFAVAAVAGCVTMVESPGRTAAVFEDVPAPLDFEMIRAQTHGYVYPMFRVYTQTFKGSTSAPAVADHYKKQMPAHEWTPTDANETDAKHITLNFTKGIEVCSVRIDAEGGDRTTVHVNINKK